MTSLHDLFGLEESKMLKKKYIFEQMCVSQGLNTHFKRSKVIIFLINLQKSLKIHFHFVILGL